MAHIVQIQNVFEFVAVTLLALCSGVRCPLTEIQVISIVVEGQITFNDILSNNN